MSFAGEFAIRPEGDRQQTGGQIFTLVLFPAIKAASEEEGTERIVPIESAAAFFSPPALLESSLHTWEVFLSMIKWVAKDCRKLVQHNIHWRHTWASNGHFRTRMVDGKAQKTRTLLHKDEPHAWGYPPPIPPLAHV